eukprot:s262_g4.t1
MQNGIQTESLRHCGVVRVCMLEAATGYQSIRFTAWGIAPTLPGGTHLWLGDPTSKLTCWMVFMQSFLVQLGAELAHRMPKALGPHRPAGLALALKSQARHLLKRLLDDVKVRRIPTFCTHGFPHFHKLLLHIASCFLRTQAPDSKARNFFKKPPFPPVAMCCGLRGLMPFFVLALDAVQAARPGVQPATALTATQTGQTGGRECRDFEGTATDENLRWYEVKKEGQRCYCDLATTHPSNGCGEVEEVKGRFGYSFHSFRLSAADSSCRCLQGWDKAKERSRVVEAAAVRFCAVVLEAAGKEALAALATVEAQPRVAQDFIQKRLSLTPELCQEVLTGTLNDFVASQESQDLFHEANRLSEHKGTKGFGHLDPLMTGGLPTVTEYQKLLHHVCRDECEDIVNETKKNIKEMYIDVRLHGTPSEESCADRVVRKVEAEMLGCCGRSCGWNGRSCASWPFLTKEEKVSWLQECCSEYNVQQNSSREDMCDSVLSSKQVRLVSQFDTKGKKGDVAGAYMGQDPRLLWAKPGLDQFEEQLKKLKRKPKENQPVSSDFFEKNPSVRQEGLGKGWFTEEKDPQERSSSLAEIGGTCQLHDLEQKMEHCPPQMQRDVLNACVQADKWQISDKPDDFDHECQVNMINPTFNKPEKVATPEECLKVDFGKVVKRRFFTFDNSDPPQGKLVLDKPILCFHEKVPCPDRDDFVRKKLNEFEGFQGFADYIYWIQEGKVAKPE